MKDMKLYFILFDTKMSYPHQRGVLQLNDNLNDHPNIRGDDERVNWRW